MEATCIKCGRSFESDSWNMDICPSCENELIEYEKDMDDDLTIIEDDSTSYFDDL